MAHLRCDFRSEVLDMNTSMTVVLPEGVDMDTVRVVYLFHGLADNCSGWSRYTSVERYARKYNLALVIPEVERSFYQDMKWGLDYFRFIHDELREISMRFFGFSPDRDKTYVMGLSMGGYAALKCALTTPERYAGCACFSAVTDMKYAFAAGNDGRRKEWTAIFGDEVPPEADLYALLEKRNADELPPFWLACGEQDERLFHSEKMVKALQEKKASVEFHSWSGDHNWDFWDEAVKRGLEHFFGESV